MTSSSSTDLSQKTAKPKQTQTAANERPSADLQPVRPAVALERVRASKPGVVRSSDLLTLQRSIGNQAVSRLLADKVQREDAPPWAGPNQSRAEPATGSRPAPTGTAENLPVDPQTGQAYVPFDLSAWGGASCKSLSKDRALNVLRSVADVLHGWVQAEKNGHRRLVKLAEENELISTIAQWLGGESMPPLTMWSGPEKQLGLVRSALSAGNVTAAEQRLFAARTAYVACNNRYVAFKQGNITGAERAKMGLEIAKAAGAAAVGTATGGAGLALAATYGMGTEALQQASEQRRGLREEFNWLQIIRRGTVDVALGLAGSAASGALAKQFAKLSPSAFKTWPIGALKGINKKLADLGAKPITRLELLPLWQQKGAEFMAAMGTKLLTEPAKIVLDELCTKNKMPTKKDFLDKMAAQFWLQEGGIEAFIMWAKSAAVPAKTK